MRPLATPLVLALWAVTVGLLIAPALGDMGGDTAQYLALAESLAAGDGYVDSHLPGSPAHVHYPPGMAMLYAPLVWVFGPYPFVPAKLLVLGLGVLGLWSFTRLFTRLRGRDNALLVLGLTAFSPYFLNFGQSLLSEMPAMAMLGMTLFALDRATEAPAARRWAWMAVLGAVCCFSLRVAGIVAPLVVAVTVLSKRRRHAVPMSVLCALPVLIFFAYTKFAAGGTWTYDAEIAARIGGPLDLIVHALAGLPLYVRGLGAGVVDNTLVGESAMLAFLVAAPVLVGLATSLVGRRAPLAWTVVLGVGIACAAPERTVRYLVPLAPLAAFFFVQGVATVHGFLAARLARVASWQHASRVGLALGALLAISQIPDVLRAVEARHAGGRIDAPKVAVIGGVPSAVEAGHWSEIRALPGGASHRVATRYASFLQLLELARSQSKRDEVLLSRKPRFVSYMTGRRCLRLPVGLPPAALRRAIADLPYDLFVDDGLYADTRKAVEALRFDASIEARARVRSARLLERPSPSSASVAPGR